ncbi:MATE family efflux transporter [Allopusillimonas ginsengisoli]|nr:MATE family efflux transporter [Allopusillimonas ginsengisoli]
MILSNLTVPLVALVDSAVVGHLPHAHQLGAVAVGASFYTVLASLTSFLRMGTTGFAAQAAGKNDGGAMRRIFLQSLALAWILAAILAIAALPLATVAFDIMKPSPELETLAHQFFRIRLFGLPATLTQYALIGWLLGSQNARAPLAIMLATNIGNIVLVLWLVLGLEWGVEGAAIASVCAEWMGVALGLLLVRKRLARISAPVDWRAMRRWENWAPLLQTNRDIFIRSLALHCVFLSVTIRGAHLGDATVAANALLLNGLLVCAYALDGLSHAVEALCGHAIGARRQDTLLRVLVVSGGWALLISTLFAVLFTFFGDLFIAMQTDMPAVRATAQVYLPYLAVLPLIAVWSYLLDGLFIGATRAREMRNAMVLSVALCLPLAWAIRTDGNHGLWIALLAFMTIRAVTLGAVAWNIKQRNLWIPA